jgi:hypothetical protein
MYNRQCTDPSTCRFDLICIALASTESTNYWFHASVKNYHCWPISEGSTRPIVGGRASPGFIDANCTLLNGVVFAEAPTAPLEPSVPVSGWKFTGADGDRADLNYCCGLMSPRTEELVGGFFRSCLSGIVWVNPTANHSRYDSLIILPPTRVCSHYRLHVIIDAKKNARNTPLW